MASDSNVCLSASAFYGVQNKRKWAALERSIEDTVKKHKSHPIPISFPARITGPSRKWKTFFRQHDAFSCCKSSSKNLHMFAFESKTFEQSHGQRMYLVASYPVFWHYYKQLKQDKRYHYEVIPEGTVCKLYFDLEYDKLMNPDSNSSKMVDIFIKYVCQCLTTQFNIACTRNDVLDLESSTSKKFSRHLIFQLKQAAFQNNVHAGKFVSFIVSQLLKKCNLCADVSGTNSHANLNIITDIKGHKLEAIGELSLSNNGHCLPALLESAKGEPVSQNIIDKFSDLEEEIIMQDYENNPDLRNACTHFDNTDSVTKDIHALSKHSLISTDRLAKVVEEFSVEDLKSIIVKNKDGYSVPFCDTGVYTKNRNFRLLFSSKMGKNNPLLLSSENQYTTAATIGSVSQESIFYDSLIANVRYDDALRILSFDGDCYKDKLCTRQNNKRKNSDVMNSAVANYGKSPYPEVDDFITSIITKNSGNGVIRQWTYFHEGELLVYEITHYRFCNNIGRHHRSNNIMFIVDLKKYVFYQKCHDPDCQNYKSKEWPLPKNIFPSSYFDDLDIADDLDHGSDLHQLDEHLKTGLDLDEEELLNTALELETQYKLQCNESAFNIFEDIEDKELLAAAELLETSLKASVGH